MLMGRAEVLPRRRCPDLGGAGGLGVFAVQLCALVGARAIAVVSSPDKAALAMQLGGFRTIDRREFKALEWKRKRDACRYQGPNGRSQSVRAEDLGDLGEKRGRTWSLKHVGAATFPTSVFIANKFARIVICGATTGFNLNFDVRHLWMHQKSIIGSHFAHAGQCEAANRLVTEACSPSAHQNL